MLFQQLVNRMCSHCLFPACWQVVNGLLTTCYAVVELNRLVTSCSNNLLSSCNSTICQQVVSDNLVATWWNNSIVTTCWQACYKPVANTSCWQVVRFLRVDIRTLYDRSTHSKISHLVASLPTSRQQVVFALLVSSCEQVWNKLLTTCNNLVDIIRLVARLFQQVRYIHDITIFLQPCLINLVTFLLYRDCIRLVRTTL